MSWKSEVHTCSCAPGDWSGNLLRFATKLEADNYGLDLALRWTAVEDVRSVESSSPVSHVYGETTRKAHKIEFLSKGDDQ